MKPVIRALFVLICLIPACGGRTAGDFENGMSSSAGASFDDEIGGASNTSTVLQSTGGSITSTSTSTLNSTGGSFSNPATGGASAVQTTGILRLHEPTVRELPGRTVLQGEKDVTVFEFTLSAEQRTITVPHMYVIVAGSIKPDELMPVTIVDEANNVVATENPTPFGEVETFNEYGGAFWLTPFTVDASAPPKTFRVKTGIEATAQIGKTFRFGIDTQTSLYPIVDDYYEIQSCNLGIHGSRFTVVGNPDTNNNAGTKGTLSLVSPTVSNPPGKNVLPGESDIPVFQFTLTAEQQNVLMPCMYLGVHGDISADELKPLTIVDEQNNVIAVENTEPFAQGFWFSLNLAIPIPTIRAPQTFTVKTGIESSAKAGKTFQLSIDTTNNLCSSIGGYAVNGSFPLIGNRFTIISDPNTNNGTGGTTSIGTGGTSSTGGSSANIAGSTSMSTGGTGAAGNSAKPFMVSIVKTNPDVLFTGIPNQDIGDFAITTYGNAYEFKQVAIAVTCDRAIVDADNKPYFTEAVGIDTATGAVLFNLQATNGPTDRNKLFFSLSQDPFTVEKNTTTTIQIRASIADLPEIDGLVCSMSFYPDWLYVRDASTHATVSSYLSDVLGTDHLDGNTFTIHTPLIVSLSKDTPKSQIVTPQAPSSYAYDPRTFSRFTVKNKGTTPVTPTLSIAGTLAAFSTITAYQCDNRVVVGKAINTVTGNGQVELEVVDYTIPASTQVELCLTGMFKTITSSTINDNNPKSGSEIYLNIKDIVTASGVHAYFDGPQDPPKMILRKAKPVVVTLPLNQTIITNGATMELFKFQISTSGEPIDFKEFSLACDKSDRITIANLRIFKQSTELKLGSEAWVMDDKSQRTIPSGTTRSRIDATFHPDVSTISNLGITYVVTGEVSGAQTGDVIGIYFMKSQAVQSFTGYLCNPGGGFFHNVIDTTDYNECLARSNTWMNQGQFLWSDMSEPTHSASTSDWTDDYLVPDLSGTSALVY